jgi:hypothetical protein
MILKIGYDFEIVVYEKEEKASSHLVKTVKKIKKFFTGFFRVIC